MLGPHRIDNNGKHHIVGMATRPQLKMSSIFNYYNLAMVCLMLGALALLGTVLGGMVLAFDNSLWPVDAYVLYVGQAAHLLCLALSLLTTLLAVANPRFMKGKRVYGVVAVAVLVLSIWALIMTYEWFFVYGFPIYVPN